jgi:hypothetical protein
MCCPAHARCPAHACFFTHACCCPVVTRTCTLLLTSL